MGYGWRQALWYPPEDVIYAIHGRSSFETEILSLGFCSVGLEARTIRRFFLLDIRVLPSNCQEL